MQDEPTTKNTNLRPIAKIIASYVEHHVLAPDQLATLITTVEQAVRELGTPASAEPARVPAVPVKRSVQHDVVVCLECGFRGQTLRRHLGSRHGMQIAEYLRRWQLSGDHPLTAPAYSARRSTMAKKLGLGRKRGQTSGGARHASA
jgi:MucR family transcriptional regulator, transcriptional regulator of exopolysaccharide biosynthesis